MKKILLLIFVVGFTPWAQAQKELLPASEISPDIFKETPREIQPGLMIYGLKWYSTPEQVIAAFGSPHGKVIYSRESFAYHYGRSHVLIFERGELREVVVTLVDQSEADRKVMPHPFFDRNDLSVAPGFWIAPFGGNIEPALSKYGFNNEKLLASHETSFRFTTSYAAIDLNLMFAAEGFGGKLNRVVIRQISIRGH